MLANSNRAAAYVESVRRYPHNNGLADDEPGFPGVPNAIKHRLFEWYALKGGPYIEWPEAVTIAWPADGTEYECPQLMTIEQVAQQTAPWDALECDRCRKDNTDGERLIVQAVVLVPYYMYLVGMVLCPRCTYELSLDGKTRLIRKVA